MPNGLCDPNISLAHCVSEIFAKKCRSPKICPISCMKVSTCSFLDCVNIFGYIISLCRPGSGKKALAKVHPPLELQLSELLMNSSKSQTSLVSVNRTGEASPHNNNASPNSERISDFAAYTFSKYAIETSLKRHLKVTFSPQSGINPSDASSTSSAGDRLSGDNCPREFVEQI